MQTMEDLTMPKPSSILIFFISSNELLEVGFESFMDGAFFGLCVFSGHLEGQLFYLVLQVFDVIGYRVLFLEFRLV